MQLYGTTPLYLTTFSRPLLSQIDSYPDQGISLYTNPDHSIEMYDLISGQKVWSSDTSIKRIKSLLTRGFH
jgi:hypothetical protein